MTRSKEMRRFDLIAWSIIGTVIICLIIFVVQLDTTRQQACEAHGWDHGNLRGNLCVDDHGVVRTP